MKMLTIVILFLLSTTVAQADRSVGTQQQPNNITVTTKDNRVIYDEKSKQLIGVKKQTVCTVVNGKKECHDRAVATTINK